MRGYRALYPSLHTVKGRKRRKSRLGIYCPRLKPSASA